MRKINYILFLILSGFCILMLTSCSDSDAGFDYTEEFVVKDGFKIEIVAAEPQLLSPVAIDFDTKGRIWAAELTGYMRDIDGSDEDMPDGRIVILEDTDGDGRMDSHKAFLEDLVLPRAIKLYNNGLLYAEPPNLWWVGYDDKDEITERVLVDTMYTNGGNIEHMPNGLLYNIDNWIYNAKSDRRYRYYNGEWEIDATLVRGQWGISNDQLGRLYYNDNSNPLYTDCVPPNSFDQNPYLKKSGLERVNLEKSRKVYPIQATSVNRGYQNGVLHPDGKLTTFTSSCSPLIYKGDQFGEEYVGNAFVCGPEVNLIKRYTIGNEDGMITAQMTDTITEFVVSRDETFRPVNLNDGPDGNMYIVDMRKGIIQHKAFITTYLIDKLTKNGLAQYDDGGRIYRVTKENSTSSLQDYSQLTISDWVQKLKSSKYWERIKAQETIVSTGAPESVLLIRGLLNESDNELAHIHGLRTLDGLGKLSIQDLIISKRKAKNEDLINTILLLSRGLELSESFLKEFKNQIAASANSELFYANALGQLDSEWSKGEWINIATQDGMSKHKAISLVSGIVQEEEKFLALTDETSTVSKLLSKSFKNREEEKYQLPVLNLEDVTDPRTRGLFLYHQNCATCHGRDGKGLESVAPPLYESAYLNGSTEQLVLLILNGMHGPFTMDGVDYNYAAAMPAVRNNPELTDEAITDVIKWIKNSFTTKEPGEGWNSTKYKPVSTKMVSELREATEDRNAMFTQDELEAWTTESK